MQFTKIPYHDSWQTGNNLEMRTYIYNHHVLFVVYIFADIINICKLK